MRKGLLLAIPVLSLIFGCNNGPKSTDYFPVQEVTKKDHFGIDVDTNMHKVLVSEVVPSSKYVYVKVKEGNREFWIATRKRTINEGGVYLYNEALLKTQFESKEHDRVFDTLYMVTTFIPENHGTGSLKTNKLGNLVEKADTIKKTALVSKNMEEVFVGAIKISDLVKDPQKYQGKMVELSGECAKVNLGIMGKNWIHLKDGSQDDFDLVITTQEDIQKGLMLTVRGIVQLNRNFGSGYVYDILLEQGEIIN
ncbi:hypothetical protein [Flagellimonas sp.]|uniref:hypothetical protein n=1 Tax=Flagellimonas sp. TaxID=2058762 RepID=UPI003B5004DE